MAEQKFTTDELESEIWRPIVGYETTHSVSSLGRIRSERNRTNTKIGDILKTHVGGTPPYRTVALRMNGKPKQYRVHVLVARAFLGEPLCGYEVNHIDNDKSNSRLSNLEYVTHKENMLHASRMGVMSRPKGIDNPRYSLTPALIAEALTLRRQVKLSAHKIAVRLECSPYAIQHLLEQHHLNGNHNVDRQIDPHSLKPAPQQKSKLSIEQVRYIKRLLDRGVRVPALAREMQVAIHTIYAIKRGERYIY